MGKDRLTGVNAMLLYLGGGEVGGEIKEVVECERGHPLDTRYREGQTCLETVDLNSSVKFCLLLF